MMSRSTGRFVMLLAFTLGIGSNTSFAGTPVVELRIRNHLFFPDTLEVRVTSSLGKKPMHLNWHLQQVKKSLPRPNLQIVLPKKCIYLGILLKEEPMKIL